MGDLKQSDAAQVAAAKSGLAAVLAVLLLAAPIALAQTAPRPAPKPRPAPAVQQGSGGDDVDDEGNTVSELVVTAARSPPGAVVGDIKPEITLNAQQVQSYGVSTVTDLLTELAPQTSTGPGSGPPVVLLNGRRISAFNEIRDIPTEAIVRVEVLPQEVALKYGYSADQRVVNIVLRPFFRAVTAEGSGGAPTEGGQVQGEAQLDLMRIRRDVRTNVALKATASTAITEDERDIIQPISAAPTDPKGNVTSAIPGGEIDPALSALAGKPVLIAGVPQNLSGAPTLQDFAGTANAPNVSDVGRYRTLTGSSRDLSANVVMTRPTIVGAQATLNATFEATHGESLQGLPGVTLQVPSADPFSPFTTPVAVSWDVTKFGPLRQISDGWTGHLGATLNRDLGQWRFTLNGAYDHAYSLTRTDVGVDASGLQQRLDSLDASFNPFASIDSSIPGLLPQNRAKSNTDTANFSFLASGPVLPLPAGKMNLSLHVGDNQSWYAASSTLLGLVQNTNLSRNDLSGQVNLDTPITRKGGPILAFLGDLTLNGNAAVDQLSDFGTLKTFGYGANWRPNSVATLLISHTRNDTAPSFQQFGGPVVVTPGVRVFDFATGQTVDVNMITGGNPDLKASRRDITRIGLMLRPFAKQDLTLTANFNRSVVQNTISTFPAATGPIQATFPERFIRDPDGDLTDVDYRPVNFTSETKSQLRWGINFTKAFGKPPPPPSREEVEALRKRFAGRIQQFQREFQQRRAAQGQAAQGQGQAQNGQQPSIQGQGGQQPSAPGADGQPPAPPSGGPPPGGFGGGPPGGGPPGVGGFRGPPGGFGGFGGGGRGGGNQPGRFQLAIYHTIVFQDQILVRPGGPVFDLLNGYPAGSGGGEPQHQIEAQAGVTWKGLGARASGKWQSATFLSGEGSPTGALYFSSLATVDLRLFADFAQNRALIVKHPILAGTRVTLAVTNLFDNRQKVRDATGLTPISYQPAYLDPVGRVVRLSLRKLFF